MDGRSEVSRILNDISSNPWIFLKEYIKYFETIKRSLLENFSLVIEGKNGDSLHDLRTSCRRMETIINFLQNYSKHELPSQIYKNVKEILKKSSKARDYYVHLMYLKKLKETENKVYSYFEKKLYENTKKIKDYLSSFDYSSMKKDLEYSLALLTYDFAASFEIDDPFFIKLYVQEIKETYGDFQKADKTDDKQLHKIRIKVKDLRYKVEMLGSLKGETLEEENLFKEVQDILGTHHDLVVLKKRVSKKFKVVKLPKLIAEIDEQLLENEKEINIKVTNILTNLYF